VGEGSAGDGGRSDEGPPLSWVTYNRLTSVPVHLALPTIYVVPPLPSPAGLEPVQYAAFVSRPFLVWLMCAVLRPPDQNVDHVTSQDSQHDSQYDTEFFAKRAPPRASATLRPLLSYFHFAARQDTLDHEFFL
jgi:hypothetical protein